MKHCIVDGLNIVTDRMDSAETISIKVMVKAGSRNESIQENGISHFLEHMAFKGTHNRSAIQIAEEFDMIGGNFNAYTSRETTVYYAKVLKNDIEIAVDIMSDILQNSIFSDQEIDKERRVILEELAQTKDTPDDYIFDLFQEKMFPKQAIGRPIIGSEDLIQSVTRDDLKNYINQHYGRNNIVISCAGNFNEDNLYKLIATKFNALKPSVNRALEAASYVGGEMRLERELEQVHVAIGFPGLSYLDENFYTQQILSIILGGGMSSRLFQEIREKRGLAYHISTFASSYSDVGAFSIYSSTSPQSINELISATAEQFKIGLDSITQEELHRAKAQVRASILMAQESSSARAERIAWHYTAFGKLITIQEVIEKIDAIKVSDLHALLSVILSNEKLPTLAVIGKLGELMPYDEIKRHFALT